VVVPSNVHATVYVGGSIDFGNGNVNMGTSPASSGIPDHLMIYGTATASANATAFSRHGNPTVAAAFYGPNYSVSIKGGGNGGFYGSITANTLDLSGGGTSAFHYDEALKNLGPAYVIGYQVAGFFEDIRL